MKQFTRITIFFTFLAISACNNNKTASAAAQLQPDKDSLPKP